jgi:uncharacterized Ntn-hydrolase superfamily protein
MTFSLAGRCARTGMFGVVVTTSSPAVGSRCAHTAAGIGAVLTQNVTDPRLGPLGLDLLRRGYGAQLVVDAIVAATTQHNRWRQLAIIDRHGQTAAFSGHYVKPERNEAHGRDCVSIANIVRSAEIPALMVKAFEADPSAHLAERLLAALQAGEGGGSEFKPLVSTAMHISWHEPFPYIDLRVDGDSNPIAALGCLWKEYEPMADLYVSRALDPDSVSIPP